jgi:hypothetical protein
VRRFCIVVGVTFSCAIPTSPAYTQTRDARAADATQLFFAFCISPAGNRDHALAVLGQGNQLARRLPDDIVKGAQGGRDGGVGWAVRSPNNAELMLDFEARGICGLRVREADESAMRDAFETVVKDVATRAGVQPKLEASEIRKVSGVVTTYRAYSFDFGGSTTRLALTSAPRQVADQQHFMTFSFGR